MPYAKGVTDYSNLNFGGRTGFTYDQQFNKVGVHGIAGASFIHSSETVNGESFGTASNLLEKAWNASAYTEWKVTLPLKFSIKAGVSANFYKFSYQNYDSTYHVYTADTSTGKAESISAVYFGSPTYRQMFKPAITPSISIDKVFKEVASVYATVSLGYTPPSIGEMIVSEPQGTVLDTSLKPERAIQYELGTKGSFVHKKLSYQVALFYMDIYNKLVSQEASAGYTYTANAGDQHDLGLELALSYAIIENHNKPVSLLRPFISYTYSDFTYHNFSDYAQINAARQLAEVDFSGNHVAGVAPNRFNAGIDFALKYGLYLNVTDQYFDKTPYTFNNLNYVKAYNLLNAKIGYRVLIIKHIGLDVYAGVNNILGDTYYTDLFVGESIFQLGDGAILPAPYKPTFYGGGTLSYRF
jgi:iron complex outermembrane receptor protein